MKIHLICAARPNFMKIAPLYHSLIKESWCKPTIIHTGQHYDYLMSQSFFDEFSLPSPHYHLNVGSGSHAQQTANVMVKYEQLCKDNRPDLVIVVGDVNSTLACTVSAKKLKLKVAHIEAGLRSFDNSMPEEINRIVTDSICDYHFAPSQDAVENLMSEGTKQYQIKYVGNIMIDAYCMVRNKIQFYEAPSRMGLFPKEYAILTLHRPTNVDNLDYLSKIIDKIQEINLPVIFPVHPRTRNKLKLLSKNYKNLRIIEPMGYVEFMSLVENSHFIITDSGGIQEETTFLKIPCYTLRNNTERPITVTMGSNQLVTLDTLLDKIKIRKVGKIPPLWDGCTAPRIRDCLKTIV